MQLASLLLTKNAMDPLSYFESCIFICLTHYPASAEHSLNDAIPLFLAFVLLYTYK